MLFNTRRVGKNTSLADCVQSASDVIIVIKLTAGPQEQISHKMYVSIFFTYFEQLQNDAAYKLIHGSTLVNTHETSIIIWVHFVMKE